jgi:hypothetical protein
MDDLEKMRWCVSKVDELIDELTRLREAKKLLDRIVIYIDPYTVDVRGGDFLYNCIIDDIRKYTNFDDSE